MNKIVVVGTLTLLVGGGVTLGLLGRQTEEREDPPNLHVPTMTIAGTQTQEPMPPDIDNREVSAATSPAHAEDDKIRATKERLAKFDDPNERAAIVAQARESFALSWKPIAASMAMPMDTLDLVVNELAEQSAVQEQRRLECQANPPCDLGLLEISLKESRQLTLEGLLGPERLDQYNAYIESIPERTFIKELQTRLTAAGRLDDDTANRLALAISKERAQLVTSADQRGKKIQVVGFIVKDYDGDKPPRRIGGPYNELLTNQFQGSVLDIASGVLNPEQLAEFKKLQEERLKTATMTSGVHAR